MSPKRAALEFHQGAWAEFVVLREKLVARGLMTVYWSRNKGYTLLPGHFVASVAELEKIQAFARRICTEPAEWRIGANLGANDARDIARSFSVHCPTTVRFYEYAAPITKERLAEEKRARTGEPVDIESVDSDTLLLVWSNDRRVD